MKILDLILGTIKQEAPQEDEDPDLSSSKLESYVDILPIKSDIVHLEGPFLCEKHALKYLELYRDLLKSTYYRVNLCISRPIVILHPTDAFETRDNCRVKLGIQPANHLLEIEYSNHDGFKVVGVDGNILLNINDTNRLRSAMSHFPIMQAELKHISKLK